MLTLYGCARSRASRPLWLFYETGLPFTLVPVLQSRRVADPQSPDAPLNTASPAFRVLSPQGEIPVLDDDGLILTESLAICLHIARQATSDICPQTPAEQALTDQWALFAGATVEPQAVEILYTYMAGAQTTEAGLTRIAEASAKLARSMTRIQGVVGDTGWLIGDRFTVADLMLAEVLRYALQHPPLAAQWPLADAWLKRCQSRPAFQQMWAQRLAEPE